MGNKRCTGFVRKCRVWLSTRATLPNKTVKNVASDVEAGGMSRCGTRVCDSRMKGELGGKGPGKKDVLTQSNRKIW